MPRREVISNDENDDIWEYNSQIVSKSKSRKNDTGRRSSKSIVHVKTEENDPRVQSQQQKLKTQKRKKKLKREVKIEKSQNTPVNDKKCKFYGNGRCPVCQMPFTLLSAIETPSWHIDQCLEVPYSSKNECQYGIDCSSELSSHYKKFRHKELARSQRKKIESQRDRDLGNIAKAKMQLTFDCNENPVNGVKQEDMCVIDLDSSEDSPNEDIQHTVDKRMDNLHTVDRRSDDQHFGKKTTESKSDYIGFSVNSSNITMDKFHMNADKQNSVSQKKDLRETVSVGRANMSSGKTFLPISNFSLSVSVKVENQDSNSNFEDYDSDIIELPDINGIIHDDDDIYDGNDDNGDFNEGCYNDDDDISNKRTYNDKNDTCDINNDDNGVDDVTDNNDDDDDDDVDFVKVEPAELFVIDSNSNSVQDIDESFNESRDVSDMLHDALSDNFSQTLASYPKKQNIPKNESNCNHDDDDVNRQSDDNSSDIDLFDGLTEGTVSSDTQDKLSFSLSDSDGRPSSTVSSIKETPLNSFTDSESNEHFSSLKSASAIVDNDDFNLAFGDSWKTKTTDKDSSSESICHTKHFMIEEKTNKLSNKGFFAGKVLANSRLKSENAGGKTVNNVINTTTMSYVGDSMKDNVLNSPSLLESKADFAINIAESVKAGKRSATFANCIQESEDIKEKKPKLEKLDTCLPLKNQKVQKNSKRKTVRKIKIEPKSGYKSVASYLISKGKTPITTVTDDESSDDSKRRCHGKRCCENHNFVTESQESNNSTSTVDIDSQGKGGNCSETVGDIHSKICRQLSLTCTNCVGLKSNENAQRNADFVDSSNVSSLQSQEIKNSIQCSPGLVIQDVYSVDMETSSKLPGGFIPDNDNVCDIVNGDITNEENLTGSKSSETHSVQPEPVQGNLKNDSILKTKKSAMQILMESSKIFYQKKSKLTSNNSSDSNSVNATLDKGLVKQSDGKSSSSNPTAGNTWRRNKNFNKSNSSTDSDVPSTTRMVQRNCPFYKKIPGTMFTVDAFKYGNIPGCKAYILSHFHYDHYIGLNKRFQNPIYCSKVTGNLVSKKIGVDVKYINTIPLNTPTVVENVEITLLEANHCPGAVLILFKLRTGKIYLHTGDFRACKEMELYPELQNLHVDCLYLDTTYCDSQYDFPGQADVIKFTVKLALDTLSNNPKTLIVCGSYTIGKERIFMAIAQALNCKVCVTREKYNVLNCLEDNEWKQKLSLKWEDSGIHVLPMNKLNVTGLQEHLASHGKTYDSILGIEPTGWTHSKKVLSLHHIKPKVKKENVTIYGVPYSEHSSFLEMKRFYQFIRPDKVLPTVNNGNIHSRRKMEVIFETWLHESHTNSKTVVEQKSLKDWMS
ncbi:DNA cross-link repair 1A protein [Mactra antiquata]